MIQNSIVEICYGSFCKDIVGQFPCIGIVCAGTLYHSVNETRMNQTVLIFVTCACSTYIFKMTVSDDQIVGIYRYCAWYVQSYDFCPFAVCIKIAYACILSCLVVLISRPHDYKSFLEGLILKPRAAFKVQRVTISNQTACVCLFYACKIHGDICPIAYSP